MDLPYTPLEDGSLRLEPLAERHREGLRAACAADRDIWLKLYSVSMIDEGFDANWSKLLADSAAGTWQAYAVVLDGEVVGISCYIAIDHANDSLEIGFTYYRPEVRGGFVNPAAKRLLLGRAFDGGCWRAQFRVDATNARSRAAVTKLGATLEGILRNDKVTWTGRRRSTAVFSIVPDEWPAVLAGLDARRAALS